MTGRPGQTLPISKEKEKEGYLSTPEEKENRERRGGKYAKKEKEKKCKVCKRRVMEQTILEVVSLPCNVCENTFEINAKVRYECILRIVHNL